MICIKNANLNIFTLKKKPKQLLTVWNYGHNKTYFVKFEQNLNKSLCIYNGKIRNVLN